MLIQNEFLKCRRHKNQPLFEPGQRPIRQLQRRFAIACGRPFRRAHARSAAREAGEETAARNLESGG
jgi:hypothetical protein